MTRCTRCLLASDIPGITFDDKGECNYCKIHDKLEREYSLEAAEAKLDKLVETIKRKGKGRRYDCVVGISGGCDSSYLLHKVVELGLRPLAFHFDNNWNMPVAESNMRKMVKALDV
ncbi:N-acetyl sugar amidotransferase, partial [Candidatus Pacearchaeota archaeon]|nr:N-acetyl sugar amidotransferase [Candidatus Pacearchaeota archaeon]